MALIKCPECGKEISDTCDVCIHCGYKLQTKKKSSLKWKWDKKISIVIIAIIIIGIVASIIFFNKYQYKRDGFVGLDKKLTLEMQPDELDSLKIYGKLAAKDYDSLYTYENIKLFEKYTGDMNISLENNDYSKINSLYFTFAGHPNSKDIIKDITAKVGEPVHKDNYNDQRYDKAYILWKLDKKHYLSYVYTFKDETAELRCGYFDLKKQEELKKCEVNLKKDKTLKKEYDKINARHGERRTVMQINTKYEMGQKVYRVVERFQRIENIQTCDICFGTGSINYKGYGCQCPKCLGKGNIVLNSEEVSFRRVYEPKEIMSVRVTVSDKDTNIRYRVDGEVVPEKELFLTMEEIEEHFKEDELVCGG